MLKLKEEHLDWLTERIPKHALSPKGGRPPADRRKVMQGIFWILDNGDKWKDVPRRFGSKSTVHRWFQTWICERQLKTVARWRVGRSVENRGVLADAFPRWPKARTHQMLSTE